MCVTVSSTRLRSLFFFFFRCHFLFSTLLVFSQMSVLLQLCNAVYVHIDVFVTAPLNVTPTGIAWLCCDARRPVRMQALTYLQRALLVHDLQTLDAIEWESCFNKVNAECLRYFRTVKTPLFTRFSFVFLCWLSGAFPPAD